MRLLLINPCFALYAGVRGHGGSAAPLNLAYIAAYLRERIDGCVASIIDAEALHLTYEQTVEQASEFKPDIIGITTTTPSFDVTVQLATQLKRALPDVPIVVGGPHVSALPAEAAAISFFDAIVISEGEETALELFPALVEGRPLDEIQGIAFRNSMTGEVKVTSRRPLITDLDKLPEPARDLLPMHTYFLPPTKSARGGQPANMLTSRGCPFACTYCESELIWLRQYRRRNIKLVVDEIENLMRDYGCTQFNFNDDLFSAHKGWLKEFADEIAKRKLDISFVCSTRADLIDDDRLALLKQMGCYKVALGLESGSARMLTLMNKKLELGKVPGAIKKIKQYGIKAGAAFVIGHYGETEETIRETIAFAKRLDLHTVAFFQASPFPGTALYSMLKERNLIRPNTRWSEYAIVSPAPPVYDLPTMSAEEIHRWVKRAYRAYYLRPRYFVDRLLEIRNPHHMMNLIRGAGILLNLHRKAKDRTVMERG